MARRPRVRKPAAAGGEPPHVMAEEVSRWFAEATQTAAGKASRFKLPDKAGCQRVANAANRGLSFFRERLPGGKWYSGQPDLIPGQALKHARLLLRHLPNEADRLERLDPPSNRTNWLFQAHTKINIGFVRGFTDELSELIRAIDTTPLRIRKDWHQIAYDIAASAQSAWFYAGMLAGRVPRSTKPDDPLCKLVCIALERIGHPQTPEAVEAVLKGGKKLERKTSPDR